jgi:hypothetical protein
MPGRVRIDFFTLLATVLTVGICGDAAAKTHRAHIRHWHARRLIFESRAQQVSQLPVRLGVMRYYGGPKSPMWRGPVEN